MSQTLRKPMFAKLHGVTTLHHRRPFVSHWMSPHSAVNRSCQFFRFVVSRSMAAGTISVLHFLHREPSHEKIQEQCERRGRVDAFAEAMNPLPKDQYPGVNLELRPPRTQDYVQVPQQPPPHPTGEQLPQRPIYSYYTYPMQFPKQGPFLGYHGAPQQCPQMPMNPY
ncbi:hypothetical protein LWI28_001544 [Acer negundo]|uniref:Uncharacterized protein n=1 Tax=Acer negundo TaxID=4023 RepID=A0AAD5J2A1_ACENE|nr:hypothetical protein LWI28_001544 [Acer negundo]